MARDFTPAFRLWLFGFFRVIYQHHLSQAGINSFHISHRRQFTLGPPLLLKKRDFKKQSRKMWKMILILVCLENSIFFKDPPYLLSLDKNTTNFVLATFQLVPISSVQKDNPMTMLIILEKDRLITVILILV